MNMSRLKKTQTQSDASQEDLDEENSPSFLELRKEIDLMIKSIPKGINPEEYRTACAVITGTMSGKSLSDVVRYYSLDVLIAKYWASQFNLLSKTTTEKQRRGSKTFTLEMFIKANIGKTFKSADILKECNITNPTLYNFINSNRGYFKKVGRGLYEIVDYSAERAKEKNARS